MKTARARVVACLGTAVLAVGTLTACDSGGSDSAFCDTMKNATASEMSDPLAYYQKLKANAPSDIKDDIDIMISWAEAQKSGDPATIANIDPDRIGQAGLAIADKANKVCS